MHAQREGEFTSMMQIVLNEMPDHPLACRGLIFSILIGIVNHFCQIGNGPLDKLFFSSYNMCVNTHIH